MTETAPHVYLDHAATTPMVPEAVEVMVEQLGRTGNANSLHGAGRAGRKVVEESRERIAAALGARPSEVVFTSGGTEADNLAVKGITWARRAADERRDRILCPATEHHAVLDPVEWMGEHDGARVDWLPVDDRRPRRPRRADRRASSDDPASVALVTVMWANNEVGTLQPVEEVVALARRHGVPVHTDAVQAVGAVPVDFAASGVDALTLTAHKLGGPYGVGALLVRRDLSLTPLLHGGGQERSVRSGTIDVPAIAAFATATELAVKRQAEHAERVAALRDDLVRAAARAGPGRPPQRRPGRPAARQRPRHVPRLRGRLAADAARPPRHRGLDRVGVLGRGAAAQPRPAGDGPRRDRGPQLAAVLPGPHQHRGRRRRAARGHRPGRRAGAGGGR